MTRMIELQCYLQHIQNGIITVSNHNRGYSWVHLPVTECNIIAADSEPRLIVLQIPHYIAVGKGLLPDEPSPFNTSMVPEGINTKSDPEIYPGWPDDAKEDDSASGWAKDVEKGWMPPASPPMPKAATLSDGEKASILGKVDSTATHAMPAVPSSVVYTDPMEHLLADELEENMGSFSHPLLNKG